jgi:hypothetical protein
MEYLKLDPSEQQYSKKELLNSEMSVLNMIKRSHEFSKLRKVEFELKGLFKRKIDEISSMLLELDKIVPKMKIEPMIEKAPKNGLYQKKREELEVEIEEIKQKLALLGN